MEGKDKKSSKIRVTASFKVGAIALAFLIIGYQAALFIHSAAVARIAGNRDAPDTVYVVDKALARELLEGKMASAPAIDTTAEHEMISIRRNSLHSPTAEAVWEKHHERVVENFPFNPNTAGLEELVRLGFSEKQARSIINYREKGGRFRRPSDFAKSFVVADSVFQRLEPYIRIPKVDINAADSAEFETLPGIGPYYAARMVSYREELKGYSYPEQLMDIYRFDQERYDGLKDLITVGECEPYPLWSADEKELEQHPYIGRYAAHGIVVFRENNPREALTVEGLEKAGILKKETAAKLVRCRIMVPE